VKKKVEMMMNKETSHWWWFDIHHTSSGSPWLQSTLAGKTPLLASHLFIYFCVFFPSFFLDYIVVTVFLFVCDVKVTVIAFLFS